MTPPPAALPSLAALKAAHAEMLKRQREATDPLALLPAIEALIRRGAAAGALLDTEAERWQAQNILDYWSSRMYRPDYEPPDATLAEFDPAQAPEIPEDRCPFLGLDAFGESAANVFFGRERLVQEIKAKLTTERLVAVLGPSGSGKSSVVRAGLLPYLRAGGLPGSAAWTYCPPLYPGPQPLFNLGKLLNPENPAAAADELRRQPRRLVEHLNGRGPGPAVLVVDQFEEIFTLCNDDEARLSFVNNLLTAATDPARPHRILLTMRTDFEPLISRLPEFQAAFEAAIIRVTPLSAAELREAITRPAEQAGLKFEDGLVDALLQDILGEPAALPLLQFTLLQLWEKRDRNRVTWEAYRALGGGRQALAHVADELYNNLIPEEQTTCRRILLRLVRPGEGTEVTSSRLPRARLYHQSDAADRVDRVLDKLIHTRLVRQSGTGAEAQVEVAHEALVRNWPTLVTWLDDERVELRQRQRLTTAAEQWARLGRDPSAVWRGVLLNEAARYDDLSELETAFIQAGQAAEAAAEKARLAAEEQTRQADMARQIAEVEKKRAADQARAARRNQRLFQVATGAFLIALVLGVLSGYYWTAALENANKAHSANTESAQNLQSVRTQEAAAVAAQATAVVAQATAVVAEATAVGAQEDALAQAATADYNRLKAEAAQRESRARLLTAQGLALYAEQPLVGLALALEGLAVIPADEPALRASFAAEVRGLLEQGRIELLGTDIHQVYASPDAAQLILDRANQPAEVHATASGALLYPLTADLNDTDAVTFSADGALYLVRYANGTGELRVAADGQIRASFPAGLTAAEFSPGAPPALVVAHYGAGARETLRLFRVADGAPLAAEQTILGLHFSEGAAAYFALQYSDRTMEVRLTADGGLVYRPAGQVNQLAFSRDPAVTYFSVRYRDGRVELRETARPTAVIRPLTGAIQTVDFPDRAARYVLLSFADGSSELRQIQDEAVVFRLTDQVRGVFYSPSGAYFGIVYFAGRAELRRLDNHRLVATFSDDSYRYMQYYPAENEKYLLLYNEFGRQELRRVTDGSPVIGSVIDTPSGFNPPSAAPADAPPTTTDYYAYKIAFSPDPQASYFSVNYKSNTAELRRTATGASMPLGEPAQQVLFGNDAAGQTAVVLYPRAPSALFQLNPPTRLITFTGGVDPVNPINFSPDPAGAYFAVNYDTAQAEVWTTVGGPRRLAPLGLAAFEQWFDLSSQRLVVRYYDNRVIVFDLKLLLALDGQALTPAQLTTLACETLQRNRFDKNQLREYLGEAAPQACP